MPKDWAQKVFCSGISTLPPSPRAANQAAACSGDAAASDSEKPLNVVGAAHMPSEAIRVLSPMRRLACITLSSEPGGSSIGSGDSFMRIRKVISAPSALT